MGMPVDPVPGWPVDRVREMTGEHDVEYLAAPHDVLLAGEATPSPLVPRTILRIGGRYLVEPVDEPDTWYMGERTPDAAIRCWGRYGALEVALRAL
jgi:hypothetical protein